MGILQYSTALGGVSIDDRTLSHLHIVINQKFRQHESFYLRIPDAAEGPLILWMDNESPIQLTYWSSESSQINPDWIQSLLASPTGEVILSREPVPQSA